MPPRATTSTGSCTTGAPCSARREAWPTGRPPLPARLTLEAESAGWDAFFLWDHLFADPPKPMAYRRGGSGPAVVLLHGILGQGRAWVGVEAALDGAFDVVTPDLIGFGASKGPSSPTIHTVGPAAQAAGFAALLDDLGVRNATLVVHDFGAPIAVLLAAARPDLVGALSLL